MTPAVCRASSGAVEHLQVARVRNLADFLGIARDRGAWIYGAAAEAPDPYTAADYSGRAVIVLGGEGAGLRPRVRAGCDRLVSIRLQEGRRPSMCLPRRRSCCSRPAGSAPRPALDETLMAAGAPGT